VGLRPRTRDAPAQLRDILHGRGTPVELRARGTETVGALPGLRCVFPHLASAFCIQATLDAAGFDFSVTEWGPELRADTAVNSRAHFFPYKIGAVDNHAASPKEYSLQGIMKELGHQFIDIWKVCFPTRVVRPYSSTW
jgi:hypothetical protein